MSWASLAMANDAEERAVVTASMNAIGQAITAWSNLLQYPAVDAPNFHKGFISSLATTVVQVFNIGLITFLTRRERKQRLAEKDNQAEDEVGSTGSDREKVAVIA